jgi:hypothetical protein
MECPHCRAKFDPNMRYYPIGLNRHGEYGYVLWQSCNNCGKFILCLKETKSLSERPYEIDGSHLLLHKEAEKQHRESAREGEIDKKPKKGRLKGKTRD